MLAALLATMRPKQWTKNAFVFAGIVFDRKLDQPDLIWRVCIAFALFCVLSSTVYIMNDLADVEKDREHPKKRLRPLPSGRLSREVAIVAVMLLLVVGLAGAFALNINFGMVALAYFGLNLAYTFYLKHIVLVDVMVIAAGYVLRALAGTVAIAVPISPWLYICTILLSLFLGFSKRRYELVLLESRAASYRPNLEHYSLPLLDQFISVVASTTIIAYALYTFSAPNLPASHAMMLTVPFVLYGIFRYLLLLHGANPANPDELLLRDKPLLISIMAWGLAVVLILYL